MLDNAKGSLEIPQRESPLKFLVNAHQVCQPAKGNVIGCTIEATEFTNVDLSATFFHRSPRIIGAAQSPTIPPTTVPNQPRIFWRGRLRVAGGGSGHEPENDDDREETTGLLHGFHLIEYFKVTGLPRRVTSTSSEVASRNLV